MGECLILKSGGGVDTSDATATSDKILNGYFAYANDKPVHGNMPNNGAVTSTLNAGGSYTIPKGFHNGDGVISTKSLESQTPGNAGTAQILSPHTAWVNGGLVTGSMVNRGNVTYGLPINGRYTIPSGFHAGSGYVNQSIPLQGAWTITPSTQWVVACPAGHYTTGQVTVVGDGNLVPWHIKKGVWLFGVLGTFEGYVPTAYDVYLRGATSHTFQQYNYTSSPNYMKLNQDNIELHRYRSSTGGVSGFQTTSAVTKPAGCTRLNIEVHVPKLVSNAASIGGGYSFRLAVYYEFYSSYRRCGQFYIQHTPNSSFSGVISTAISVDVLNPCIFAGNTYCDGDSSCYIYRIWWS